MSTITCPSCGKPVKPGARFCGNCGNAIPVTPVMRSAAPSGVPPARLINCPHCGKPNRPGAKFCNHCGQLMGADQAAPPAAAAEMGIPVAGQAAKPPISKPVAARAPAAQKTAKRSALPWILLASLGFIGIALVGGFFLMGGLKIFKPKVAGTATLTPAAPAASATQAELVPTLTQAGQPPPQSPIPSPFLTSTPTPTSTLPPQATSSPVTATPQATLEPTREPTSDKILPGVYPGFVTTFQEDFAENWGLHWQVWGGIQPKLGSDRGDSYLSLNSQTAGIASSMLVNLAPGNGFDFMARVLEAPSTSVLIVDWDAGEGFRQKPAEKGAIHLEIRSNRVQLVAANGLEDFRCELRLTAIEFHRYWIRVKEGLGFDLVVDGDESKKCSVLGPFTVLDIGRVSFSGQGWLTSFLILIRKPGG